MSFSENLQKLHKEVPDKVKIVAVSKTKSEETILEAYNTGHKIFGENRVQELVRKYENLPGDIEWHMVGHLQTNKVKYIAGFVSLIHSVDSIKLLDTINKEAAKCNRIIDCLLQLRIAKEETKFGLTYEEIRNILSSKELEEMKNVRITGLMGMATFTGDENMISSEFNYLAKCFQQLKLSFYNSADYFKELSMGMSNDYHLAVKAGTTMIRIGSILFGAR
ncbi:MAG: YggS family pyridoxal phosphate-dependent enzyme [Bacteroidales bacterium]|nr:MAG: YggS family pyridoxal phosphate-dependent enzyme [Bacteroidales bacterium]